MKMIKGRLMKITKHIEKLNDDLKRKGKKMGIFLLTSLERF